MKTDYIPFPSVFIRGRRTWPQIAGRLFVVVAAVAVDLAADFAARPSGAVNIHVSSTGTNRRDQFIKLASADAALVRQVRHICCGDGA